MEDFDLVIVGGGILGTTLAHWISLVYDGKIAVLEMAEDVARHTSGRNTGIIHRPFYLDPEKRKVFARSAQISYGLWKKYAQLKGLPWKEIGTLEVATDPGQVQRLEKYAHWAVQNGMSDEEIELLNPDQVRKLEPNVNCMAAIHSKTDTSVDFRIFTESVKKDALSNGIRFLFGFKAIGIEVEKDGLRVFPQEPDRSLRTRFLVNCAGGNAVDIAHAMGCGLEFTDLHFRGEYWEIAPEAAKLVQTNIYTVPKHPDIPFLDPHWIVRANGAREIGPNAVLVSGSETYDGYFMNLGELIGKVLEKPILNKVRLFANPDFLKLAYEEWVSSISKGSMVRRVQKFIPKLNRFDLLCRGVAGIRSSVIDSKGNFVKEAIALSAPFSHHILNYNSPGATGSPAYTALLLDRLEKEGSLSQLKKRTRQVRSFWDYQETLESFL